MRTLRRLRSVFNRPQTGLLLASLREAEEPRWTLNDRTVISDRQSYH